MPTEVKWGIALLAGAGIIAAGWKLPIVLTIFHVLICIVLIGVVLMQSGKAADLAGAFGGSGSQTAFGPRGAANLLTRMTTWCFIMFLATTVTMTMRQTAVRPTGAGSGLFKEAPAPTPKEQPPAGQTAPAPTPQTPAPAGQQPPAQTPQPPPAQPPAKAPTQPE